MRLIGAIGWLPRCLGELCGSDEALCLDAQLLTLEQITRSSSVERAAPWYAAMRVQSKIQNDKGENPFAKPESQRRLLLKFSSYEINIGSLKAQLG